MNTTKRLTVIGLVIYLITIIGGVLLSVIKSPFFALVLGVGLGLWVSASLCPRHSLNVKGLFDWALEHIPSMLKRAYFAMLGIWNDKFGSGKQKDQP